MLIKAYRLCVAIADSVLFSYIFFKLYGCLAKDQDGPWFPPDIFRQLIVYLYKRTAHVHPCIKTPSSVSNEIFVCYGVPCKNGHLIDPHSAKEPYTCHVTYLVLFNKVKIC